MRCAMFCPHDAINVGLLRFWKVNGAYRFKQLLADPNIPADFVREDTKGYFRLFRKYYRKADAMLARYGICVEPQETQKPDCDSADEADDQDTGAAGMG